MFLCIVCLAHSAIATDHISPRLQASFAAKCGNHARLICRLSNAAIASFAVKSPRLFTGRFNTVASPAQVYLKTLSVVSYDYVLTSSSNTTYSSSDIPAALLQQHTCSAVPGVVQQGLTPADIGSLFKCIAGVSVDDSEERSSGDVSSGTTARSLLCSNNSTAGNAYIPSLFRLIRCSAHCCRGVPNTHGKQEFGWCTNNSS